MLLLNGDVFGINAEIAAVGLVDTLGLSSFAVLKGSGVVVLTPGMFLLELLSVGGFGCSPDVSPGVTGFDENVATWAAGGAAVSSARPAVSFPGTGSGAAARPVDRSWRNSSSSD